MDNNKKKKLTPAKAAKLHARLATREATFNLEFNQDLLVDGKVQNRNYGSLAHLTLKKAHEILDHYGYNRKFECPRGVEYKNLYLVLKTFEATLELITKEVFCSPRLRIPLNEVVRNAVGVCADDLAPEEQAAQAAGKESQFVQSTATTQDETTEEQQTQTQSESQREIYETVEELQDIYDPKSVGFDWMITAPFAHTPIGKTAIESLENAQQLRPEYYNELKGLLLKIASAPEVKQHYIEIPRSATSKGFVYYTIDEIISEALRLNPNFFIAGIQPNTGHYFSFSAAVTQQYLEDNPQLIRDGWVQYRVEPYTTSLMSVEDIRPMIALENRDYFWENYRKDILTIFIHELLHFAYPHVFTKEYVLRSATEIKGFQGGPKVEAQYFPGPAVLSVQIVDKLDELGLLSEEWQNKKPSFIIHDVENVYPKIEAEIGLIDEKRYQEALKEMKEMIEESEQNQNEVPPQRTSE